MEWDPEDGRGCIEWVSDIVIDHDVFIYRNHSRFDESVIIKENYFKLNLIVFVLFGYLLQW